MLLLACSMPGKVDRLLWIHGVQCENGRLQMITNF